MCFETIDMIIVSTIKTSDDECYRFPLFKLHFLLALFKGHLRLTQGTLHNRRYFFAFFRRAKGSATRDEGASETRDAYSERVAGRARQAFLACFALVFALLKNENE